MDNYEKYLKDNPHSQLKDRRGQKVGKLTYTDLSHTTGKRTYWKMLCDCGTEKIVRLGSGKSCGCVHSDLNKTRARRQHKTCPEKFIKKGILFAQKTVYKRRYDDGNISIEKFIELSKLPCHYCGVEKSNSYNPYLHKDGKSKELTKKAVCGTKYKYKLASHQNAKDCTFEYNGLDRIDQTKSHNLDNVVPCCATCNYMKRNMSKEEFETKIKEIYSWITKKN